MEVVGVVVATVVATVMAVTVVATVMTATVVVVKECVLWWWQR
jgi:hypothetical protein